MPGPQVPPPRNGAGLLSLVLGIFACGFSVIPFASEFLAVPAAVIAVGAAFVGWDRIERGIATNRADTIAGGILGALALGVATLVYLATHS
ncbi:MULTISPECIES: hypothetical protein [Nocardia]|uniref:hypothetical protein n=1 Tax=Nocardia TaxID=1817 RepID=UPI0015EFC1E1|nr:MULTISPECIES: hypothetical protein [Nocardia]MCA2208779.1 hypothetical protein [Nocardia rosealba]